jgi:hypothetical protein
MKSLLSAAKRIKTHNAIAKIFISLLDALENISENELQHCKSFSSTERVKVGCDFDGC